MLRAEFSCFSDHLTRWLPKRVLKQDLSAIQVTTFLALNNFGNIWPMKMIFSSKTLKISIYLKNAIELAKNVFSFEDNYGWTRCWIFSQLWQEYLWSAVNMLENGSKISDLAKNHDTKLKLFDITGKLAWKCYCADYSSVSNPLTRWLPKGVLKLDLSCIQVTTFFGLNNLQNIWDMNVIFVFVRFKILCKLQICNKTCRKFFWFQR